ncbi:MAG: Hpt domain-containing protein [Sulfurimonas sp.]
MLIYNSVKEFIGIDEHDLKALGFSDFSQLRSEAADFADLFVRTPGYVHNFKHVHWIDFVSCAESAEESKVIISVKSKSYTASLSITKAYLTDKPNSEAYFVALNGLRPLSSRENETVTNDLRSKSAPVSAIDEEQYKEMIPDEQVVEDAFDFVEETVANSEPITFVEEPYAVPDAPLNIDFEEEELVHAPVEFPDEEPEPLAQERATSVVTPQVVKRDYKTEDIVEDDDDGYVFDPQVASDELGLPVDLIEEFIEDFTGQAQEFKAELYSALDENDLDSVASLSHKLKGVAANLRIENALSAITTVNISKDPDIIKTNLDLFYRIMNKLGGGNASLAEEPVAVTASIPAVEEIQAPDEEDDFVLDFKVDDEVPVEKLDSNDAIKDIEEDDFVLDFKEETQKESQSPTKAVEVSYSKELSANAIGLDMEIFDELFVDYIQDSRAISSKIHQALAQNNLKKCAKEAKILKGMSNSMQLKEFDLELKSLISSSDKNEMTNAIKRIDNVIEQISK